MLFSEKFQVFVVKALKQPVGILCRQTVHFSFSLSNLRAGIRSVGEVVRLWQLMGRRVLRRGCRASSKRQPQAVSLILFVPNDLSSQIIVVVKSPNVPAETPKRLVRLSLVSLFRQLVSEIQLNKLCADTRFSTKTMTCWPDNIWDMVNWAPSSKGF